MCKDTTKIQQSNKKQKKIQQNMEKSQKLSILTDVYQKCLDAGKVRTKQEFADLLKVNRSGLSSAMNGSEKCLTDSLISKVIAFSEVMDSLPSSSSDTIPVVPTGARAGTLADFAIGWKESDCERIVSPIKGASMAMQVTGDSMSPEYPSGSQVILKQINERSFIEWGKVFVLDTQNGAVLKQIFPTDKEDVVECRSMNPAYPPFRVATADINGWYRVLMVMALK